MAIPTIISFKVCKLINTVHYKSNDNKNCDEYHIGKRSTKPKKGKRQGFNSLPFALYYFCLLKTVGCAQIDVVAGSLSGREILSFKPAKLAHFRGVCLRVGFILRDGNGLPVCGKTEK
jgi:hypothetical protein